MEILVHPHPTRGTAMNDFAGRRGGGPSRNKQWVAGGSHSEGSSRATSSAPGGSDTERRERGRGRGRGNMTLTNGVHSHKSTRSSAPPVATLAVAVPEDPVLETAEEREKFYQELVKLREIERKTAIAQGTMDDPLVPKRLEDAISMVGTCADMCPRFERYRRERENNLFEWETIPGTKRVDHSRAVKMYERAAGDKTLPSDLRPPHVLKSTLDYLFHDLLPRSGFSPAFNFIRDRSRAVRNDFTMQHNTGPLAMECHERCARFHILALFLERDRKDFSIPLEEQQLMNTLQSLKEFYNDQRETYASPAELEMRIYHRLIHIRDQVERSEPVPLPPQVADHPMYKLTTAFRAHVQERSKPITKTSRLTVDAEGMRIFGELAQEMMGEGGGGKGMVFLVACILERLFGKGTVDGIEEIRGGASWGDIIDGVTGAEEAIEEAHPQLEEAEVDELDDVDGLTEQGDDIDIQVVDDEDDDMRAAPSLPPPAASSWLSTPLGAAPPSAFGPPSTAAPVASAFSTLGAAAPGKSVFSTTSAFGPVNAFGPPSAFGPVSTTPSSNGSAQNGNGFAAASSPFLPPVAPPSQPQASASSPPIPTPSSNVFAVPPRVQNNPFTSPSSAPQTTSPFASSSSLRTDAPTPPPNNIFAPTPTPAKPAEFGLTDKGKTKATESFSWGPSPPSTSALNPQAPAFTPPSALFPPQPAKPVFGVTPIPLFNGFPTSTSAPASFNTPPPTLKPAPKKGTPPLAKIDTSSLAVPQALGPPSPLTPGNPPPLAKVQPISLPSTPTVPGAPGFPSTLNVEPNPSSPRPNQASNPLIGFLKSSLQTSGLGGGASGGSGMLSPLMLPSPSDTPLRHSFSPVKEAASLIKGADLKGKGKERAEDVVLDGDLDARARAFEQRGLAVRTCFETWQRRTTDRAEWAEACRQSEKYSEKVRWAREREKEQGAMKRPSPRGKEELRSSNKRIKLAEDRMDESELNGGILTEYEAPRTDEDLAKRFQENKEEHARRWAQGSFLQIIRTLVKSKSARPPSSALWRIWLSLNPESDPTAIWLECKFDVPGSGGQWVSESPPPNPGSGNGYPGIIVFECTAVRRKYRVLDDCSRLRDLIKHFLSSMVERLVSDSAITGFRVFCVTAETTDLDHKFTEAMSALQLDVEGRLVQILTLRDVFKLFDPLFNSFVSEWMENCSSSGHFNWALYYQLIAVLVPLLNMAASLSMRLVEVEVDEHVLPSFQANGYDSESTFEAVNTWLADSQLHDLAASIVATDLQSHREMRRDFPSLAFIDHLRHLALYQTETHVQQAHEFFVSTRDIAPSLEQYEAAIQPYRTALNHALRLSLRRSPRRRSRSLSEDTEQTSSTYNKRRRISGSTSFEQSNATSPSSSPPHVNGRTTPSPSNSTVSLTPTESSSAAPRVTIAMLRALTKDVKSKYGRT
ncbi:SAC3/GANP/Nin1/mts3/eIF-3 p25 family-domain-containing protein [Mycena rebaudengoi]|nr:SAC3/GANP/Nin1/mts3/eIF-3 p25 family-domain-containing protein [Mycena rebaudengoi]